MTRNGKPPAGRERFRPLTGLRRRSEFQRAYQAESRCVGAAVLVHVFSRQDDLPARLGITVSRRCGKACVRNRIRRRLREMIRREALRVRPGWDIVLTARQGAADASYSDLRGQVIRCLKRQGVFVDYD